MNSVACAPATLHPGGVADFSIRDASPDDTDAFVDNMWAVGAEGRWIGTEVPFDRERRGRLFRESTLAPATGTFVAEVDGQVIAHLGLLPTSYGTLELGMVIRDGFREMGIGTALMETGLPWARTTPAHKLELQVWPDNARAIRLYEKFGFDREGYLRQHYRRNDGSLRDAVVMGLLL